MGRKAGVQYIWHLASQSTETSSHIGIRVGDREKSDRNDFCCSGGTTDESFAVRSRRVKKAMGNVHA